MTQRCPLVHGRRGRGRREPAATNKAAESHRSPSGCRFTMRMMQLLIMNRPPGFSADRERGAGQFEPSVS